MKIKIGLDYGHGGEDSGAIGLSMMEKTKVLNIGKKLKSKLLTNGIAVVESRESDKYVSLEKRVEVFNKSGVDIIISLHCNSFNNPDVKGLETFCYYKAGKETRRLRNIIHTSLVNDKIFSVDRYEKEAGFYILRRTVKPCILVELGFISNREDNLVLYKDEDKIVNSLYKGIMKYFNISNRSETKFYVVAESFKSEQYAKKEQRRLESMGIYSRVEFFDDIGFYRVVLNESNLRSIAYKKLEEYKQKGLDPYIVK